MWTWGHFLLFTYHILKTPLKWPIAFYLENLYHFCHLLNFFTICIPIRVYRVQAKRSTLWYFEGEIIFEANTTVFIRREEDIHMFVCMSKVLQSDGVKRVLHLIQKDKKIDFYSVSVWGLWGCCYGNICITYILNMHEHKAYMNWFFSFFFSVGCALRSFTYFNHIFG